MRKVKLFIASSLDGFIAREDGSVNWLFSDLDYGYKKFYDSIDTVIMGRKTYEKSLELEKYPFQGKTGYVFTENTEMSKDNNIEFINDVLNFVNYLVKEEGKDIWLVGGSDIISILINANILNEIILSIHPIILGSGIPLFKDVKREINLQLLNSIKYDSGLMQMYYSI